MRTNLLRALTKHSFYEKVQPYLKEELFTERELAGIYRTLVRYYGESPTDISLDDLYILHTEVYNPAMTSASKQNFRLIFDNIERSEVSEQTAEILVKSAYKRLALEEVATLAAEGATSDLFDAERFKNLSDSIIQETYYSDVSEVQFVTKDLDELLVEDAKSYRWQFPINSLNDKIGGIGNGTFSLVAARPNGGKTAFIVGCVFQPEGFLDQGAKVSILCNEEKATRTMLRAFSAVSGFSKEEIIKDIEKREKAKDMMASRRANFNFLYEPDFGLAEIEEYIKTYMPDILIIDQLDKIKHKAVGNNVSEDMRSIYTKTRALAMKYDIAIIVVCQASAEAEGKKHYSFDSLEHSKTGKAAELDLAILIGSDKTPVEDDGGRYANLVKNKLGGKECSVFYRINKNLSRLVI